MISIPIPFITAGLFWLLLIVLIRWRIALTIRTGILLLVWLSAILSLLVALRWSTDWRWPRFLMPILSAVLAPVAWSCFHSLSQRQIALHVIPILIVVVLAARWLSWLPDADWFVVVLLLAYGLLLIAKGSFLDGFSWSRVSQSQQVSRAAIMIGFWLCAMALIDGAIAWDFAMYHGQHSEVILSVTHLLLWISLVGWLFFFIPTQRQLPQSSSELLRKPQLRAVPQEEQQQILDRLLHWLLEEGGYQSHNLSLDRMSRKLGVPVRQISTAINQLTGQNVSQWVNTIRIEQAKAQLIQRSDTVTEIMQDCGFLTKSNFNREFRRVTGVSPTEWRARYQHQ